MEYSAVIECPVIPGNQRLGIHVASGRLTTVEFISARHPLFMARSGVIHDTVSQLQAYFSSSATTFTVPLSPRGTPFQHRVWDALRQIPHGRTSTYGKLAKHLRTSARAVGMACRANPIPIIIPCHRVVAANSDGGYMGHTAGKALQLKRRLLEHEHARH